MTVTEYIKILTGIDTFTKVIKGGVKAIGGSGVIFASEAEMKLPIAEVSTLFTE